MSIKIESIKNKNDVIVTKAETVPATGIQGLVTSGDLKQTIDSTNNTLNMSVDVPIFVGNENTSYDEWIAANAAGKLLKFSSNLSFLAESELDSTAPDNSEYAKNVNGDVEFESVIEIIDGEPQNTGTQLVMKCSLPLIEKYGGASLDITLTWSFVLTQDNVYWLQTFGMKLLNTYLTDFSTQPIQFWYVQDIPIDKVKYVMDGSYTGLTYEEVDTMLKNTLEYLAYYEIQLGEGFTTWWSDRETSTWRCCLTKNRVSYSTYTNAYNETVTTPYSNIRACDIYYEPGNPDPEHFEWPKIKSNGEWGYETYQADYTETNTASRSYIWHKPLFTGNMMQIDEYNQVSVKTTCNMSDVVLTSALPANPNSTTLYLIPESE